MSMSKFASQADYWKDRAEKAETALRFVRDVVKDQQIAHQVVEMEDHKSLLEYLNEHVRDGDDRDG